MKKFLYYVILIIEKGLKGLFVVLFFGPRSWFDSFLSFIRVITNGFKDSRDVVDRSPRSLVEYAFTYTFAKRARVSTVILRVTHRVFSYFVLGEDYTGLFKVVSDLITTQTQTQPFKEYQEILSKKEESLEIQHKRVEALAQKADLTNPEQSKLVASLEGKREEEASRLPASVGKRKR